MAQHGQVSTEAEREEADETRRDLEDALKEVEHARLNQLVDEHDHESPRTRSRLADEENRRLVFEQVPYTREELLDVLHRALRNPNFQGLAALEMYVAVAQHLKGQHYLDYMEDGLGYFNLGPKHPRRR